MTRPTGTTTDAPGYRCQAGGRVSPYEPLRYRLLQRLRRLRIEQMKDGATKARTEAGWRGSTAGLAVMEAMKK